MMFLTQIQRFFLALFLNHLELASESQPVTEKKKDYLHTVCNMRNSLFNHNFWSKTLLPKNYIMLTSCTISFRPVREIRIMRTELLIYSKDILRIPSLASLDALFFITKSYFDPNLKTLNSYRLALSIPTIIYVYVFYIL